MIHESYLKPRNSSSLPAKDQNLSPPFYQCSKAPLILNRNTITKECKKKLKDCKKENEKRCFRFAVGQKTCVAKTKTNK